MSKDDKAPTPPAEKQAEKPKMVEVIAVQRGWDNVKVIEPGTKFLVPVGAKAQWFKPVAE